MKHTNKLMLTLALTLFVTACATNDEGGERGGKGSDRTPPAEAFTACESLSQGDACSVTTPRGEMSGTCKAAPSGQVGALACAPEDGKGGKPRMSR